MKRDPFFISAVLLAVSFFITIGASYAWPIPQEIWSAYSSLTSNGLYALAFWLSVVGIGALGYGIAKKIGRE